jgi:hypothetical protein
LAINAKGGEILSPKQKNRTTTNFKVFFKKGVFNWYLKIFDLLWVFTKIGKTLLNTKRRISFRGVFLKSKEKHLKQGEKNFKS